MSAFQTILFDRGLSYTPQGTIYFDSPVTFTMPVNIPGGVGEQTINVDTINPYTPSGPVTVTTNLIVASGHSLEANSISPATGSTITMNGEVAIPSPNVLEVNTIGTASGPTISVLANVGIASGNSLFTNIINPSTGTTTNFTGNVSIDTAHKLEVDTMSVNANSRILVTNTLELSPGMDLLTDNLNPSSAGATTTGSLQIQNPGTLTFGTQSELHEVSGVAVITETSGPNNYALSLPDFYGGGSSAAMSNATPLTLQNTWYGIQMTTASWQNNVQQNFTWSTLSPSFIWQLQYNTPAPVTSRNMLLRADLSVVSSTAGTNQFEFGWFLNPTVNAITGLITGAPIGTTVQVISLTANDSQMVSIIFAGTAFPQYITASNYVLGVQCISAAGSSLETEFATVSGITFGNGQY